MTEPRSDQAAAELVSRVRKWLDSPEGEQEVAKAVKEGIRMSNELAEARIIDPERLREPFTV